MVPESNVFPKNGLCRTLIFSSQFFRSFKSTFTSVSAFFNKCTVVRCSKYIFCQIFYLLLLKPGFSESYYLSNKKSFSWFRDFLWKNAWNSQNDWMQQRNGFELNWNHSSTLDNQIKCRKFQVNTAFWNLILSISGWRLWSRFYLLQTKHFWLVLLVGSQFHHTTQALFREASLSPGSISHTSAY